jgi:hypothetical protein
MVGVQVREEDPLHILPPHLELREALLSTTTCVEDKFLFSGFHQDTWSESIHHRRGTAGTQEGHRDLLSLRYGRNHDGDTEYNSHHSMKDGRNHITPPSCEAEPWMHRSLCPDKPILAGFESVLPHAQCQRLQGAMTPTLYA